jgi:hypothetical protein
MFTKTFDVRDIDTNALKLRAKAEANRVWNQYQDRSWKQAYKVCLQGHAAELHTISQGFIDIEKPYMDQLDLDKITADNKVWDITNVDNLTPWLQGAVYNNTRDWRDRKAKYGDGMSDRVYVWLLNKFKCSLYAVFVWSDEKRIYEKSSLHFGENVV